MVVVQRKRPLHLLQVLLLFFFSFWPSCSSSTTVSPPPAVRRLFLDIGPNLGRVIPLRIRHYLRPWIQAQEEENGITAEQIMQALSGGSAKQQRGNKWPWRHGGRHEDDQQQDNGEEGLVLISFGDSPSFHALMEHVPEWKAAWERNAGGVAESFGIFTVHRGEGITILAGNGFPIDPAWNASTTVHTGAAYAAYEIMQQLGFAFWSPLEGPVAPLTLQNLPQGQEPIQHAQWEEPRWRSRTFHLHTQHPLELTDVLQGFDLPFSLDRGTVSEEKRGDAWGGLEEVRRRWEQTGLVDEGQEQQQCDDIEANPVTEHHSACEKVVAQGGHCELWEEMVPDVLDFMEWAVAHRSNRVEWILLGNRRWGAIVDSPLRQERLRLLAELGQGMGLMIGVDDPIAFQQQHSWVMTTTLAPKSHQLAAVRARVDWLLSAGLDFLSTESGYSEFSAPNDQLMLDLLDTFARQVNGTWGKEATVKVHCSTNQFCQHFQDPRTGKPLNFNFLPTYADSALGVLPHTVQAYGLDDPTAGVYGNQNFSVIREYMFWEGKQQTRHVHFYPETAYFVNVDIDVPLFLPLYAERRLHDLLFLAEAEEKEGQEFRLSGTWNFDSGWEWGYWLNDVIMADAAWDPRQFGQSEEKKDEEQVEAATAAAAAATAAAAAGGDNQQCSEQEGDCGRLFHVAVERALRVLPAETRTSIAGWMNKLASFQYQTLLLGDLGPKPCPNQVKLSGIAYLCGKDSWVEIPRRLGLGFTQPNYVAFEDHTDPNYPHVAPLLAYMEERIAELYGEIKELVAQQEQKQEEAVAAAAAAVSTRTRIPAKLLEHLRELRDGTELLYLRAKQVRLLYQATAPELMGSLHGTERQSLLAQSREVLEAATAVVRAREQHYHAPLERIAGWRENPTVYHWDYLWSVKSLYFWWRDQGRAEKASLKARWSYCYLNRIDPLEVAFGLGQTLLRPVRTYAPYLLPFSGLWSDCLAPPAKEFEFPEDL